MAIWGGGGGGDGMGMGMKMDMGIRIGMGMGMGCEVVRLRAGSIREPPGIRPGSTQLFPVPFPSPPPPTRRLTCSSGKLCSARSALWTATTGSAAVSV